MLPELEKCVLQNDANDHNVILDETGTNITGLIDFGDIMYSAKIFEICICVSYGNSRSFVSILTLFSALLDKDDIMSTAKAILAGFTEQHPVTPLERSLIHFLVCCRMCQSVSMGAYNYSKEPENEYLLVTAVPGWTLLRKLLAMTPTEVTEFNMFARVQDSS